MTEGTIVINSLDSTYCDNKPKTSFFSGGENTFDGEMVSTAQYWATQAEASAAAAAASEVAAKASEVSCAADEVTVSAALVAITDQYLGPHSTPPTHTQNGTPLAPGMMYFNTNTNQIEVYTTLGTWQDIVDVVGVNSVSSANSYIDVSPITGDVVLTFDDAALDSSFVQLSPPSAQLGNINISGDLSAGISPNQMLFSFNSGDLSITNKFTADEVWGDSCTFNSGIYTTSLKVNNKDVLVTGEGGVELTNTLPWEALQKFNVGAEVSHSTTGAIPAFLANQKSSGLIADFTYLTDTKLSINNSGNLVSKGTGTFDGDVSASDLVLSNTAPNITATATNGGSGLACYVAGGSGAILRVFDVDNANNLAFQVTSDVSFFDSTITCNGRMYASANTSLSVAAQSAVIKAIQLGAGNLAEFSNTDADASVCTIANDGSIASSGTGTFDTNISAGNQTDAVLGANLSNNSTEATLFTNQWGTGPLALFRGANAEVKATIANDGSISSAGTASSATFDCTNLSDPKLLMKNSHNKIVGAVGLQDTALSSTFKEAQIGSILIDGDMLCGTTGASGYKNTSKVYGGFFADFDQVGTAALLLQNRGTVGVDADDYIVCRPFGGSQVFEVQPDGSVVSSGSGSFVGSLSADGGVTGPSLTLTDASTNPLLLMTNTSSGAFLRCSNDSRTKWSISNAGVINTQGKVLSVGHSKFSVSDSVLPPLDIHQEGSGFIARFVQGAGNGDVKAYINSGGDFNTDGAIFAAGAVKVDGVSVLTETFKSTLHGAVDSSTDFDSLKSNLLAALA